MDSSEERNSQTAKPASSRPGPKDRAKDLGMHAASRLGAGLRRLFGSRARGSLGIITYHRVTEEPVGVPKPLHNVTPERFREQITGLQARGFNIWPLNRVLEHRARDESIPPRTLVITFDDGYGSLFTNAWPVLNECEAPATVFLNTAFLEEDAPFPFDAWGCEFEGQVDPEFYRPLTFAECDELHAGGLVELGNHTHTHRDFRGKPEEFAADLETSLAVMRTRFDLSNPSFAFPYGSAHLGFASPELIEIARAAGLTCALTTEPALVETATDPFGWGRFNVFSWDTSSTLAAKLGGWYSWAPRTWQRITGGRGR